MEKNAKQYNSEELWNQIGFVRPLGGLLCNILLILGGSIFGVLFSIWLMPNIIYPFPTAMGWESMTKSLFSFYFAIADIGLGTAIQRFIGEQNVKNPRKTIQYLQFFIYFQMFTGLLQITILSIWVFTSASNSDLAYASWFFLLYSTVQWPGMLGVFNGALQAYQRFDRANLVSFIQAILLENTTRIICILIGRWWGTQNPMVGELMGATIGSIIGAYLDDFLAALIAGFWLRPILKEINPDWGIIQVFHVDFDKSIIKECLTYGLKIMLQGIIFPAANLISVFVLKEYLPNYPTIWGVYLLAEMVGSLSGAVEFNIISSFSEAFNNGKKLLAQDYITRVYRWTTLLGGLILGLLFAAAPLIGIIAGESFVAAVPMIRVYLFFKIMEIIIKLHDKVFRGGGKPEYNIIVLIVEQTSRLIILYFLLTSFPPDGMAIVLSRGLGWVIKFFVSYWIIEKVFLKIKINYWQTIIAPSIATLFEGLFIYGIIYIFYPLFTSLVSNVFAAILILGIGLLSGPFLIWFPSYAYFGGWDTESLEILNQAYQISGISKPLVKIIISITTKFCGFSPLHNRFPIKTEGVKQEIEDLIQIRKKNLIKKVVSK